MPVTVGECLSDNGVRNVTPVTKQKMSRRLKAVTSPVNAEEIQRPRKRRRSQTTMTQLDLGRRSFFDVIGDSDEEGDSEIDTTPKPRKPSQRRKLPVKTESQDTLTQFVKRASDMSELIISDSENEGSMLSDLEPANIDDMNCHEAPLSQGDVQLQDQMEIAEHAEEQFNDTVEGGRDLGVQLTTSQVDEVDHLPASQLPQREVRTPKRIRMLPVPSSRSPPDTLLSTQNTPPRAFESFEPRSPLQERSANIQKIPQTLQNGKISKSPRPKQASDVISVRRSGRKRESPIKRRVRDFNTRFAILEQENAHVRSRRVDFGLTRSKTTLSSGLEAETHRDLNAETQYTMPGFETQAAWLELPVADQADEVVLPGSPENRAEIAQCTQLPALSATETVVTSSSEPAIGSSVKEDMRHDTDKKKSDLSARSDEILIPSSQSRKSTHTSGKRKVAKAAKQETSKVQVDDESLPESTYNSLTEVPVASKNDTQDLASDQLMRETQQAFLERVPSSPVLRAASSARIRARPSKFTSQERHAKPRPSQATTVDESMTFSSLRPRSHRSVEPNSMFKKPAYPLSSSPAEKALASSSGKQVVVISSPLTQAPDLTDLSSSPFIPEPKTPTALRNLKAPLQLNDLISESLDQSYPMPPSWRYDDEDEEDDGEL